MMTELYRLVLRMREDLSCSRNRSFDELSQPLARRARRIERRLRGIEKELRAGALVEIERRGDGYLLRLGFPAVRMHREAHLTAEEHALLCRDPVLEAMLVPPGEDESFRQPSRFGRTG